MSPRFVLGRENVPCVADVVNRSLKADCTDFTRDIVQTRWQMESENAKDGYIKDNLKAILSVSLSKNLGV